MAEGISKISVFDIQSNLDIGLARMIQLDRLGLDLDRKTLIYVGSASARMTQFWGVTVATSSTLSQAKTTG